MNTNLVESSSRSGQQEDGKKNKYIVIYYATDGKTMTPSPKVLYKVPPQGTLLCVSVDDFISKAPTIPCSVFKHRLHAQHLNVHMNSVCTSGGRPRLYLFGGKEPYSDQVHKIVYSYDLRELPGMGCIRQRDDMISETYKALSVQVGEDSIYVLTLLKDQKVGTCEITLQNYNIKEDKWMLFDNKLSRTDVLNNCNLSQSLINNHLIIPHVVIGHKFHVSLGRSSFTFDTYKGIWEDSKLFETFWSAQGGLSQSSFCRENESEVHGGSPFGFYGKAIIWDKNILLGVHQDPEFPLVAYLLDSHERVIKSQTLTFDTKLYQCPLHLFHDACLVDLDRDGYFGFVHLDSMMMGPDVYIRMLTFKVTKRLQPATDDQFLECQFVRIDFLTLNSLPYDIRCSFNAFCV